MPKTSEATQFILIPSDTYNRLQQQPPEDPAVTIQRQAVLVNNRIPESIKPKIIAAIDRHPRREVEIEAGAEEEEEEAQGDANETTTTSLAETSTAVEDADTAVEEEEEVPVGRQTVRERIFKKLDTQIAQPIKREKSRQIFDFVSKHRRITVEPHTQSFVVDGSNFNTIDVASFLYDMQTYNKRLPDAYKQLVVLTKIPLDLLVNRYAKELRQPRSR
jgi:hypothetical protein